MKKTLTVMATAATLAIASVAAPQYAEARGGRVAAGVIGGLAAGAIIGSALAGPRYYGPGPAYYGPGPVYYGPSCYWTRQRWWDGWRWHHRRIRVCN
jgi:hypothetical protein